MKRKSSLVLLTAFLLLGCARTKDVATTTRVISLQEHPLPPFEHFELSRGPFESVVLSWQKPVVIDGLTVTLEKVEDSRCPKDVLCIWAGSAVAQVLLTDSIGASVSKTLSLGTMERVELSARTYQVTLRNITPYPSITDLYQIEKEARVSVTPL